MTRVLVVDDSVAIRGLVSALLSEESGIEVAGVAPNGRIALQKYGQLRPDIVTLDVEMPEMDGLETLRALRAVDPQARVIMLSGLTHRGAVTTFDALAAGAVDYVAKPTGGDAASLTAALRSELSAKIRAHCEKKAPVETATPVRLASPSKTRRIDVIAVGCSTGGPNALASFLASLPTDLRVPVLIVQHMPELFTKLLAERLDATSRVTVHEGVDGEPIEAGHAYIAPGGKHMEIFRDGNLVRIRTTLGPPENSCRPAADVTFRSIASVYGAGVLTLVLTGMGQDGLRGCESIHRSGGQIIVQDEESSVVWGMPRAVAEAGLAHAVLPLDAMGQEVLRRISNRG